MLELQTNKRWTAYTLERNTWIIKFAFVAVCKVLYSPEGSEVYKQIKQPVRKAICMCTQKSCICICICICITILYLYLYLYQFYNFVFVFGQPCTICSWVQTFNRVDFQFYPTHKQQLARGIQGGRRGGVFEWVYNCCTMVVQRNCIKLYLTCICKLK